MLDKSETYLLGTLTGLATGLGISLVFSLIIPQASGNKIHIYNRQDKPSVMKIYSSGARRAIRVENPKKK